MNISHLILGLIGIAATIITGALGFFLRRTIGEVDTAKNDIKEIKEKYATKEELDVFRGDLKDEIKKLSDGIDNIKDNYIKKDDFVRAIADTNNRVEKIYNFLLDMNGGKRNG
jgi:cell division protein FtsB